MKKSILSLLLAVVLTFGATQGMVSAFASIEADKDTPIAEIDNDNYQTFHDKKLEEHNNLLDSSIQRYGEFFGVYENEEEYNRAQEKRANKLAAAAYDLNDKKSTVKKTIQVLDKKSSKPISNAIVRLNGVPRFTDKNGEVRVLLTDPVYELYVEKNTKESVEQYNPHMEFIYVEDEKTDTTKTIYLKRPSDDLEIFAVNLRIGSAQSQRPQYYNLLEQKYHFALDYMDYPADIILETNVAPDFSCLYVNGKLDRMAVGNDFIYFDYNKMNADGSSWYKPEDTFTVSFIYEGIESKQYPLLLEFVDLDDIETPEVVFNGSNTNVRTMASRGKIDPITGGPSLDQDYGLGDNYSIDIVEFVEFLSKNLKNSTKNINRPKKSGRFSIEPKFSATYNTRTNTLAVIFGFEIDFSIYKTKQEKELYEQYQEACKEVRAAEPSMKATEKEISDAEDNLKNWKNQNKNEQENYDKIKKDIDEIVDLREKREWEEKEYGVAYNYEAIDYYQESLESEFDKSAKNLSNIAEQIKNGKDALSSLKQDLGKLQQTLDAKTNKILKGSIKVGFELKLLGKIEFNVSNYELYNLNISLSLMFSFSYTKHFMAGYVPMYLKASVKVGVKLEIVGVKDGEWYHEFLDMLRLYVQINIRGDAGVGLYDLASAGAFIDLLFNFFFQFGDYSDNSWGRFELSIGIRVKLLFFEWEFQFPNDTGEKWQWYFYGDPDKKDENAKAAKLMARSAYSKDNTTFNYVYQDSKPQMVNLGDGKYLTVWLQDSIHRDDYNRTELVYAIYDNGQWGDVKSVTNDTGTADFYPQLLKQGDNVYLAWQRLNGKLTENDSLYDMAARGEVWCSEFDLKEQIFTNTQRLTNDNDMDLAPKFATSNMSNGNITLIWQKNSNNDILGLNGVNSIVYSSYVNGKWSDSKTLYSTENIITYVTGAIDKNELLISFIEDTDKDVMTSDDRELKLIKATGEKNIIDSCEVGASQFVNEQGNIALYYYKDGNIMKTDLTTNKVVLACSSGDFDSGFNVVANEYGTVIFYNINGGESKQSFCVIFDAVAKKWTKGVKLSQCLDNADYCSGFITETGSIAYAHLVYDDIQSYAGINFGLKELKYSVEIKDAYFLGSLKNNEKFELFLTIENTGDYELNELKISLFGQEQVINLEEILKVGEERTIVVNFYANLGEQDSDIIIYNALINGIIVSEDTFIFYYGYVDYELSAEIQLVEGKQLLKIYLNNLSNYNSNGSLLVYVNGEARETRYLENVCQKGEVKIELYLDNLMKDDVIYIEFISDSLEIYTSNNNKTILSLIDSLNENVSFYNPYEQSLSFAKEI